MTPKSSLYHDVSEHLISPLSLNENLIETSKWNKLYLDIFCPLLIHYTDIINHKQCGN